MFNYTCGECEQEWTIRNNEEPLVVTCPKCKKQKRTKGRRNPQEKLDGKVDPHFGDLKL